MPQSVVSETDGTVSVDDATTDSSSTWGFQYQLKESSTFRILQMSISVECETSVESKVVKRQQRFEMPS